MYLHCHTKGCGWSQDDFYTKDYNTWTKIWDSIQWLWVPRMIEMDSYQIVPDLVRFTHVPVIVGKSKKGRSMCRIFSWNWLVVEIVKDIKNGMQMKWRTYNDFRKDSAKGKAVCPKCHQINFDLD